MAPPNSGSLPLGNHHFYLATVPCPTVVEECGGAYTEAMLVNWPKTGEPAPRRVGSLSCPEPGGRQFTTYRVDANSLGIAEAGHHEMSGTYSASEDHHMTILCANPPTPGTPACGILRFATRDQALESFQRHACPQTSTVDGGEIMQLELHLPHTMTKARRSVIPGNGTAFEVERDVLMGGVGGGLSWKAPRSWPFPLTAGVYGYWMGGSPRSITGDDATIDVERRSVFGHVGFEVSSDWIRQMVVGSPVAAWPVEFFFAAEYHVGYDHIEGQYTFPHAEALSIDEGGLTHFPSFMLGITILLSPCAANQCPKIPNLDIGYFAGLGGLTGGSRGGIHESINRLDGVVRLGVGTYEQIAPAPPLALQVPSGPEKPLADHRPAPAIVASVPLSIPVVVPGVRLERVDLEDKHSFVRSLVLFFDTNKSTITRDSRVRLSTLLTEAGRAQSVKQSSFIHLNFEGHADSRNSDGYNAKLSEQRANTTKVDLTASLEAHTEFGPIMRERGKVTIDSIGLGETKPLDAAGRIIDTEGCKETTGKNHVAHLCSGERIVEDLNMSRRVELFIQGEATKIAIELKQNRPDAATQDNATRKLRALESAKRTINGADIYPLGTQADENGLLLDEAFANYSLLKQLPRRRFVSVVVSGDTPAQTDVLVERILPVVRAGRSVSVNVMKVADGQLGDGSRVFIVVHPLNVEWDLTNADDANVKAVLEQWSH